MAAAATAAGAAAAPAPRLGCRWPAPHPDRRRRACRPMSRSLATVAASSPRCAWTAPSRASIASRCGLVRTRSPCGQALAAAEVLLGAKQYTITEHLAVPSGTSIKGAGATATTLTFSLRPPRRGEPAAAFEMVKHAPQISTAVTCMQSLVSALPLHPTIPITSLVVCCNVGRSALL